MKGSLIMRPPINGAIVITQLFGGNPKMEAYTNVQGAAVIGHTGIDINAAESTDVYPAWNGQISITDSGTTGLGLHATIKRVDGVTVTYGHLSSVQAPDNSDVYVHQPFAKSGSTGNSTGPHIHLEVRPSIPDRLNGYDGCTDPLPNFDHDVIDRIDLSLTNL